MQKKAYLIHSATKTVSDITIDDYTEISKNIGCEIFTTGTHLPNGDTIYVDDEGLLINPKFFFMVDGCAHPFAGNGVVVGADEEGESVDVKTKIEDIWAMVKFMSPFVAKQYFD